MNEHPEAGRKKHIPCVLARNLLLRGLRGRWVRPGLVPELRVAKKTHSKLLKIRRLLVFQFGQEMPCFRQATDWQK
jgi:hypothetical protein